MEEIGDKRGLTAKVGYRLKSIELPVIGKKSVIKNAILCNYERKYVAARG